MLSIVIEEVVFGREHDGALKLGIKSRKVPEEIIEYERFKDHRVEGSWSPRRERASETKERWASEALNRSLPTAPAAATP